MPEPNDDRAGARRFRPPAGLLGMLGLALAFELAVAARDRHSTDAAMCWRETARAAVAHAPGCDALLFGDSLVKFGVLPRVVAARGGPRAYNLALHAGPIPASYFLLRRALDAGARPRAVVLDAMTHGLAADPRDPALARGWAELATARDALDLAASLRDPGFLGRVLLARAVPSVRARHELRAAVLGRLGGRTWSPSRWFRILRRNWEVNRGAQPHVAAAGPVAVDPGHGGLFPRAWRPDPVNVEYLRRFARLAASRGITAYVLIPPLHPEVQARRAARHLDAAYDAFLRAEAARLPNLVVLDARRARYDESVFRDAVHLDRDGASALSDGLARALAGPADGPRWRPLPDFRRAPAPDLIEDLEQSRLAARRGGGARRR
jgi:hypothetical protein